MAILPKKCYKMPGGWPKADEVIIFVRTGMERMIKSFKVLLVLSTGVTGRVIISGRELMVDPIFI